MQRRHFLFWLGSAGASVIGGTRRIAALSAAKAGAGWQEGSVNPDRRDVYSEVVPSNTVWPRAFVLPKPIATVGVREPIISLGGEWKLNIEPPAEFWSNSVDPSSWIAMQIPTDLQAHNLNIKRGREYSYKRKIRVPDEFAGKRVVLRFEGVTGQTRVWVNGVHLRDHFGGFTAWCCDITDQITPGADTWVTLGITDTSEGINAANVGGILRDIEMIAVPENYISRFNIETDLDESYNNAVLKVWVAVSFHNSDPVKLLLALKDPQGRSVPLDPGTIDLSPGQEEKIVPIPVKSPVKWDAEHPNLYTIEGHLLKGESPLEVTSRRIGFRKIERVERIVLVNGKEVKLRGVNHRDIGPMGSSINPDAEEQDVKLLRDANINCVRTAHCPPMEAFLDACDRYGMYVEEEAAVSGVDNPMYPMFGKEVANDSASKPLFLNQLAEQIERDRSHPSVLIWSLANESNWGSNMQAEFDYIRQEDPTRLIIFSFGCLAPGGDAAPYDVYSLHYPSYSRDLSGAAPENGPGDKETNGLSKWEHIAQPVFHDEWAHVPAYDVDSLRVYPGMRNFYGESISRFWESLFPTEGALGGAIWTGIDTPVYPAGKAALELEWGLLDIWRRPKPEYWNVKKAYSPVRLDENAVQYVGRDALPQPEPGKPLQIRIKNWFNHTNLNELRVAWSIGGQSGALKGPDVEPQADGVLSLPPNAFKSGSSLNLKFYRLGDLLVDEYNVPLDIAPMQLAAPQGPAPVISERNDSILVSGANFELAFSKETGLITRADYKGVFVIQSGPYLQLTGGRPLPAWSLKHIKASKEEKEAIVTISGGYGETLVTFVLRIDNTGLIQTTYTLDALPDLDRKLVQGHSFSRDVGGYFEVGVAYVLNPDVDSFAWSRKGLWSAYPSDHIGRNKGTASRSGKDAAWRLLDPPRWPWSQDEKDFILFGRYDVGGRGTNDFRSMKGNIYFASAILRGTAHGMQAESTGTEAARLEVLDDPRSLVDAKSNAVKLAGSWEHTKTGVRSAHPGDSAELTFSGTTICWFGPRGPSGGAADVYIDGKLEAPALDLYARPQPNDHLPVDMSHEILFSKEGLTNSPHTIKLVVREKASPSPSAGNFVTVDWFQVLNPLTRGPVRFIVNNLWNYPRMSWGNYVKDPVLVRAGYSNSVRVRLSDRTEPTSFNNQPESETSSP